MGRAFHGLGADPLSFSPHEPSRVDERAIDATLGGVATERKSVSQAVGKLRDHSNSGVRAEDFDLEDAGIAAVANSQKIQDLIARALDGQLPRDRALKDYEPNKLNPRHISVIMLRAVGYRQNRICELTGYEPATVSVVLGHPDARTILSAILTAAAAQTADISATVRRHAPEMLNIVRKVAVNKNEKAPTRLRAAFKWLDMYDNLRDREVNNEQGLAMDSDDAARLAAAIAESREIEDNKYVYVGGGGGEGSASGVGPASDPASLPGGASEPDIDELESLIEARLQEMEHSSSSPSGSSDRREVSISDVADEEVA